MKLFFKLFLMLFLLSCQEEGVQDYLNSRSNSLSLEERQALFPNELFTSLVNQEGEEVLQNIIDENGHYLFSLNEEGDTPLSTAIKFYNQEGALFIAKQLSPEHYLHQNSKGEGYIYLASQKAYVDLIKLLSDRFYESQGEFFRDYEFSDLDMQNESGERALHVAKNYITAEALEYEYWRGSLEYPLRKFQYLQNKKGQSFLHTAIRDQNSDLLRWAVQQNCSGKEEWEELPFYYKYSSYFWQGVQAYGKTIWLDWDNLINAQDQEGMTAINYSAKNMFLDGIRILSNCQWTDYLLKDNQGNIPVQNFLLALDPLKENYNEPLKETFVLLMESQTKLTWEGISDQVNSLNQEGESSLHISARMVDPFFYNQLQKYGDIEQKNKQGETPREIFNLKRQQMESL